jgi:hypothetical protein
MDSAVKPVPQYHVQLQFFLNVEATVVHLCN